MLVGGTTSVFRFVLLVTYRQRLPAAAAGVWPLPRPVQAPLVAVAGLITLTAGVFASGNWNDWPPMATLSFSPAPPTAKLPRSVCPLFSVATIGPNSLLSLFGVTEPLARIGLVTAPFASLAVLTAPLVSLLLVITPFLIELAITAPAPILALVMAPLPMLPGRTALAPSLPAITDFGASLPLVTAPFFSFAAVTAPRLSCLAPTLC